MYIYFILSALIPKWLAKLESDYIKSLIQHCPCLIFWLNRKSLYILWGPYPSGNFIPIPTLYTSNISINVIIGLSDSSLSNINTDYLILLKHNKSISNSLSVILQSITAFIPSNLLAVQGSYYSSKLYE